MGHCHYLALCVLALTGCRSPEPQSRTAGRESPGVSAAVDELNRQIEKFNAGLPSPMGIFPIRQRIARVEYVLESDVVNAFDAGGELFLVLNRQPDGRFKGVRMQEFHTGMRQEGDSWCEEWGEVFAEFALPGGMF